MNRLFYKVDVFTEITAVLISNCINCKLFIKIHIARSVNGMDFYMILNVLFKHMVRR